MHPQIYHSHAYSFLLQCLFFPLPSLYLLCRRFSDLSVSAFHKTSLLFSESEALRFLDVESGIEKDMIFRSPR